MQPDDHAFVVARLHLPSDCSDRAAVAAAWPPDTLGFSNLDPPGPTQQHTDLLVNPQPPSIARHSSKMRSYSTGLHSSSHRDMNAGALARGSNLQQLSGGVGGFGGGYSSSAAGAGAAAPYDTDPAVQQRSAAAPQATAADDQPAQGQAQPDRSSVQGGLGAGAPGWRRTNSSAGGGRFRGGDAAAAAPAGDAAGTAGKGRGGVMTVKVPGVQGAVVHVPQAQRQ